MQQVVSCAEVYGSVPWSELAVVNGSGCFGGYDTSAYDYMIRAKYVSTVVGFPYVSGMPWRFPGGLQGGAQNGQCRGPYDIWPSPAEAAQGIVGPAVDHADWAPSAMTFGASVIGYATVPRCSAVEAKAALAFKGPLVVVVDASQWHSYDRGVFDGCRQDALELNHAVLLVGYGTDERLGDYWLVRNSWGTAWGEDGYIRLKRTEGDQTAEGECTKCVDLRPWVPDVDAGACATVCGTCGLLTQPSYPVVGSLDMPSWDPSDAH